MEEAARRFLEWDPNPATKSELHALLSAPYEKPEDLEIILKPLFLQRIAFGTAGLRAAMGPGYSRMNDLIILQTCQGLSAYLTHALGKDIAPSRGVVIGYDHRAKGSLSSQRFARISAAVFAEEGFKVYLLENFVATPFVAFATTHLNCCAGIMVTASHNPKADNGYKVYWGNGSQIIPPHDSGIAAAIMENLCPKRVYSIDSVTSHPLVQDVTTSIADAYYAKLTTLCLRRKENLESPLKVVYTAMHGVGLPWIRRAFELFGHKDPIIVREQASPDPEFSTVSFPNPEEQGALTLAMKCGDEHGANIIVANDPDADRLAAAERQSDGKWYAFTGNEIGVLLGSWAIERNMAVQGRKAVLASIVSSRMLKAVALAEGVEYHDTLTGFKWLGNRSIDLKAHGVDVLFAYEEALGYCVGDVVCDKDGISAASVFIEMAAVLASKGMTVSQRLKELSEKYGEFVSFNSYVICHDPEKTKAIFQRLRTGGPSGGYWVEACGVSIVSIKDVTLGYDSTALPGQPLSIPATPESEMIMYEFSNGCTVTLRTSGTEPKIKFYTEIAGKLGESRESVHSVLITFVEALVEDMLQPSIHGLGRP